jgi:PAS domain S-box-containing protein
MPRARRTPPIRLACKGRSEPTARTCLGPFRPLKDPDQLMPESRHDPSLHAAEAARAIIETSPFAAMAFDTDCRITLWSPGAERLFGWTASEVLGRPFPPEAIPEDERAASSERIRRALDGGTISGERVRRRTRDGRELILEIHGQALRDGDGNTVGYGGQMVDVTTIRDLTADLALVANVGSLLAGAVHSLGPTATLEEAAQSICDRMTSLPSVDVAVIGAFDDDRGATVVASSAPRRFPLAAGMALPTHRAASLFEKAARGPWAEHWVSTPEDGEWGVRMDKAGLKAFAFGPLIHFDHVDGGVVIGTRDASFAETLVEKWASVVDFSTTPSALLADRLHVRRFDHAAERRIRAVLSQRAFWPVFQPIVELGSGDVVGHEALTRFASGIAPDRCFAEAWASGLGFDLEFTTLLAAVNAARDLPPGRWLDLNITPRLLEDPERLRDILWSADRPVVLEITEHDAIEDYGAVRDVVRSLGHDIRLAVDDAGAGVANFGHIVELGPDFVKLDRGLTRRVNGNLGRQALVVGMRHFARTAGCRLIAEGIETEDEARTLTDLGVEFGQGYLFGRPEPIGR